MNQEDIQDGNWPGMSAAAVGDRVGLLLDFEDGSLAVYKNGERLGLMVQSGLEPPLRWCADLDPEGNTEVRIAAPPMPDVSDAVKAQEAAAWARFLEPTDSEDGDDDEEDDDAAALPAVAYLLPPDMQFEDGLG